MSENSYYMVAAVIVTFNRKEILMECIRALLSQSYSNLDILVIDNASTDGTHEYIKEYIDKKEVLYFNTGSNLGGAGGFNLGVKKAVQMKYDYIWLMDDDTITLPDSLLELMEAANILNDNFGFLSSFAKFTDGTPCIMNIPSTSEYSWIYEHDYLNKGLLAIKRATFVSLLIPRRVVLEQGLPIKEFFVWTDDTEYTKRISKNYPCYFVNNSVVIHKTAANKGATQADFVNENEKKRLSRYKYKFRNQFFVAKEEGMKEILRYCYTFVKLNIKCLLSANHYKLRKIIILWEGFVEGIFFNPSIEKI